MEQQTGKTVYQEDQSGSQAVRMLRQRAKDGTLKDVLHDWLWIWSFSRGRWGSVVLYTLFGIASSILGLASGVIGKYLIDAIIARDGETLLPLAALVTPNIPEAQVLTGLTIRNKADMITAAKQMGEAFRCAVLLKGGHSINDANDLLYANGELHWFEGKRINNPNTHGTGCTLSSAIAAQLAKGLPITEAVRAAKEYINNAIAYGADYKITSKVADVFSYSGKMIEFYQSACKELGYDIKIEDMKTSYLIKQINLLSVVSEV